MRKLYLTLLMATFGLMIFCVGASFPIVPHDGTQSDPALLYASDTVAIVFDDVYSPENIDIVKIDVEVVRQGAVVATWEFTDNIVIAGAVVRVGIRAEAAALRDPYFIERKLYPNVDFYSGIIMRALGIPVSMFTVMFAIGRMPGWIANYREVLEDPNRRIYRPRQIYTGPTQTTYAPIRERQ